MKFIIIASAMLLVGCSSTSNGNIFTGNNAISPERMWYPNKTTTFYSNNGQQAFYGVTKR